MEYPREYKAGFCNIGEKEIRLRKRILVVFGLVALFFSVCYLMNRNVLPALLLVFISSAIVFLIILEIRKRFCVLFGIFNLYNFGKLGELNSIRCRESSRKDRYTALRMITISLLLAALYVKLIFFTCVFAGW